MRQPTYERTLSVEAVNSVFFSSALHHFIMFGKAEGRPTGTAGSSVFNLTTGVDTFEGGFGPIDLSQMKEHSRQQDQLSGGGGADLFFVC